MYNRFILYIIRKKRIEVVSVSVRTGRERVNNKYFNVHKKIAIKVCNRVLCWVRLEDQFRVENRRVLGLEKNHC